MRGFKRGMYPTPIRKALLALLVNSSEINSPHPQDILSMRMASTQLNDMVSTLLSPILEEEGPVTDHDGSLHYPPTPHPSYT